MGREQQIIDERLKKLKELQEQGIETYPSKVDKKQTCLECLNSKIGTTIKTAGRVMTKRDFGQIGFANLKDGTGEIQLVFQTGETKEEVKQFMKKYIDSGDFIQVDGKVFKTQKFWNIIRTLLIEKGFLEVETPILETSAGGATATPFKTHHNALDTDVYLRISMGELWQKKLMVAGLDKTFEIGRQFRNEGMDAEHLQDYTQMEFYWAYADYKDGMKLVQEMYKKIAKEVFGTTKFKSGDYEFDLNNKWELYDYEETVKKYTGINIFSASVEDMLKKIKELNLECEKNAGRWKLVDSLWKYCRKKIAGPGFLVGHPVGIEPLAKRDINNPEKVQEFQVIIAGTEVGKGYSELNDPFDQEKRFEEQMKLKNAGDTEAQEHDKEFIEALKHGMPPTCGFGVSERLFGILMNKPLRECVIFPLMKPEVLNKKETKKK